MYAQLLYITYKYYFYLLKVWVNIIYYNLLDETNNNVNLLWK